MVAPGKRLRNGSSLPTPFWMMTRVDFFPSTAGDSCSGTISWLIALWAQTTKSKVVPDSAGVLTTETS